MQQPAAWLGALEGSRDVTLVVDEAIRVSYANRAARQFFELGEGPEPLAGLPAGELIGCVEVLGPRVCGAQEACPFCGVRRSAMLALEGREVRRQPIRLAVRGQLGTLRELELLVSARPATGVDPHQVILVLEPNPKESDHPLRKQLDATRAILDEIPVPVFVKAPERQFVYINREAERVLGVPAAEAVGKTDVQFFPPEVVPRLWAEDDRVLQDGEELTAEQVFEGLPDGPRTVLVRKRRSRDASGGPVVLSIGTDITELKKTQLELEASRRRVTEGLDTLRGVVEALDAAIFSVDREYRYTSFNAAHAGVMRALYGAEVALGHSLSEYQRVPEDWVQARANLDRVLAGEAFVVEALSGDAGLEQRTFEVGHSPVRDGRGAVIGAAVIARDVTARRLAERALRETEDRLRQSQKMEAIGRLAGGVAHDFNNLLTVILASADLGLLESGVDQPVRLELEEIRAAGLRAQALTRQLLAFSRRQVLQPQVVDLNVRVRDVEKLLVRLLGEDVEVRSRLAPDLQPVVMDPNQLEQVILNLAVNARDAMPRGGTLSVETANVVLDEDYAARHVGSSPGPQVMLAITDTGAGMDAETRARVFEPFFTTKAKGKGTGLGLSTVYGIVKQSGGSIWVYSELGRGTTFKIYLPRASDGGAQVPSGPLPGTLRARSGESLLVVEDDDQVRRTAVRCLETLGYVVTSAGGLNEAVRLVDEGLRFTLLLTDVIMPGGTGVEVAREVCARLPSIGLVFMSGYTDDAISQHGVLSPGALFLEKPFTKETLGRKIREAMDLVTAAATAS